MPDTKSTRTAQKPEKITKDALAAFFNVDMDNLTKRALQMEQTQATKVNFYLVLVTAVIGALLVATTIVSLQPFIFPVACLVLLVLHILGWLILYQVLDLNVTSTILYRRVSRIRQWFLDEEPSILPYLPFSIGDDQPPLYLHQMPLRGIETVLLFVNAVLAGLVAGLGWLFLDGNIFHIPFSPIFITNLIGVVIGIVVLVVLWFEETAFTRRFMQEKDRIQHAERLIHFPFEKTMENYSDYLPNRVMDKK